MGRSGLGQVSTALQKGIGDCHLDYKSQVLGFLAKCSIVYSGSKTTLPI